MNRASKGLLKPGPGAQINWAHPLARGLVFYMPFTEGGGNPRDLVGPPSNGVWNGIAYWSDNFGAGSGRGPASSLGTAANLSKTNYLTAGTPTKLQFTQASSFSIHAISTVQAAGSPDQLWTTDPGGATRPQLQFGVNSNNLYIQFGDNAGTLGTLTGGTNLSGRPSSQSRHLTAVRDVPNTNIKLYVDGVQDASGSDASTGTWTIGASAGAGDWGTHFDTNTTFDWIGLVSCIAVWNRPLSADEVQTLYRNPWCLLIQGTAVARAIGISAPPQTVVGQGIPTSFSAGTGTVVGPAQRVFGQGIPSSFRAGYGTVVGGGYQMLLYVGGVQFPILRYGASDPAPGGAGGATAPTIQSQTLGRWTAHFDVFDPAGAYVPAIGQTVTLIENGLRLFMGCISEVAAELLTSTSYVVYHVTALDKSSILDHRDVNVSYAAGTDVAAAVRDIVTVQLIGEGITVNTLAASITTLDQDEQFYWVTARQALDKLATDCACVWWVDAFGDLHFQTVVSLSACPFSITDTSNNARGLIVKTTLESYRNKQIAISNLQALPQQGGTGTSTLEVTETYTLPQAAAVARGFLFGTIITQQPVGTINSFKVNNVSQPVYSGFDGWNFRQVWWWFAPQNYIIPPNAQNDTPAFPTPGVTSADPIAGDVIEIKYIPTTPAGTPVGLAPAGYGSATGTPLSASGGTCGTGIYEAVEQVKNVNLQANLDAIAAAVLARSGGVPKYFQCETDEPGAQVGQLISVNLPLLGVTPADSLMITSVMGTSQGAALAYGSSFRWQIVAQTGQDKGNAVKWFERFIARTENPLPIYQYDYLKFVLAPGSSLAAGVNVANNPDIVQRSGKLVLAYGAAGTPPVGQDLLIDILVNGVSIFATGQYLIIPAGDSTLQSASGFVNGATSTYIFEGDLVTVNATYRVLSGSVTAASGVSVTVKVAI